MQEQPMPRDQKVCAIKSSGGNTTKKPHRLFQH